MAEVVHDCIDPDPPRCEVCFTELKWTGTTVAWNWRCPECEDVSLDDQ